MNSANLTPDDLPAIRARVPENVASGQISTGVIVVTGPTEFVLDFVRSLPRPSAVVSRVILPHSVMPQFVEALEKNIDLYNQRFGLLPGQIRARPSLSFTATVDRSVTPVTEPESPIAAQPMDKAESANKTTDANLIEGTTPPTSPEKSAGSAGGGPPVSNDSEKPAAQSSSGDNPGWAPENNVTRHPRPHEVYDELKLRDELLSGAYANAVMIGHGQFEFSFDFITNFYPQSAVSARVYTAAGHIIRLHESLRTSWQQLDRRNDRDRDQ